MNKLDILYFIEKFENGVIVNFSDVYPDKSLKTLKFIDNIFLELSNENLTEGVTLLRKTDLSNPILLINSGKLKLTDKGKAFLKDNK